MPAIEYVRYTVDPSNRDEFVDRWRDAVNAIRERFPGLMTANLANIAEDTWMDVWFWESRQAAQEAAEGAPGVPAAAAMFALISSPPTMEHGEVVEQG